MAELRLGCPVTTTDGAVLGVIRETEGSRFKLDAGGEPDYWLALSQVFNVLPDRVTMRFDRPHLKDYKLD